MTPLDRRQFLTAGALGIAGGLLAPGLARAMSVKAKAGATLEDIEHVVILMQENRSFDHYFGMMSGVIGFDDPHALPGVFRQADPDRVHNPDGYVLPYRIDTFTTSGQFTSAGSNDWFELHVAYNDGRNDSWVRAMKPIQLDDGYPRNPQTMGYFTPRDIPYHWALADAFTICDSYHCSVMGSTNPNRVMLMSGTINPEGGKGGPLIENYNTLNGSPQPGLFSWRSFPEELQDAGVDWYVYQEPDNFYDNMLPSFDAFTDTTTDLYRRGNSFIPSTKLLGEATAARIKRDVLAGRLPQVSYIVGAAETSEHEDYSPGRGAQFIDQVLDALTADLDVWAKTLLIINYDENGHHFDHVVPPTPPPGTPGEFLLHSPVGAGFLGPVGLGFRVPLILVSPFTRGPLVCSDVFDHTSVIQLLERRFGVHCPNISDWRRSAVGDLTSAINFAATPTTDVPARPDADQLAERAAAEAALPAPEMPTVQTMPRQFSTPVRGRPSGLVTSPR